MKELTIGRVQVHIDQRGCVTWSDDWPRVCEMAMSGIGGLAVYFDGLDGVNDEVLHLPSVRDRGSFPGTIVKGGEKV